MFYKDFYHREMWYLNTRKNTIFFTCEDIDNFTDIRFVSKIVLKFVGVSSKHLRVFLESARQSSEIFGNFRKFSENVRERSSGLRDSLKNLRKSLEGGRKSSENHQKRRSWQERYLTHSLRSLVRYCSCHSNIKFISSRHRVIFSI